MKNLKTILVFLPICLISWTTAKKPAPEPFILKIGDITVPTSEFKYVYNKNNANTQDAYSEKSIREYLELYIKFKLKVKEAERLGLDTTKGFNAELNGYKKQLALPYLTEKGVTEKLIREAYERLKEEVKAAHILIRVSPDADPKDSLDAYNKILDIRKRALAGENFESLARQYSQDPSAQMNGGNLGYFTALQMVYPFEEGAYKTTVGQVSNPVRTKFGYHLIKVMDRRKAQGEVKVAHIMIRYASGGTPEDSLAAVKKINEIYAKLKNGENWTTLTSEFSEDFNSRAKGGELPAFTTGNMIPSFEEAAFKLNAPDEYGAPIQTPYGFHIIKLLEKKGLAKFEEMEAGLKSKVSKDSRSDLSKAALISRLKTENKFTENPKVLEYAYSKADSNLSNGKFSYNENIKENKQVLFTLNTKKYTVNDFFAYVKTKNKKIAQNPRFYMGNLYKEYVNESLISYEEANLEGKYLDYKMLVKEYRDGILLFQLMDTKVWSKAIEDTAGLKKFYNDNRDKYMWGKRVEGRIINAKDKQTADLVKSQLNNKFFEVTIEPGDKLTFDKGKAVIKSTELKKLDALVNVLGRDKNYVAEITGSEEKGETKPGSKIAVSKQRIEAVSKYLVSKGVDNARIVTVDQGAKPAGKGNSKVGYRVLSTSISGLEKSLNEKAALTVQIKEGKFQVTEEPVLESINLTEGIQEISKNDRYYVVQINKVLSPEPKSFDEAKGLIISDYQNYLEKQWVEELKSKYPVTVNQEEVNKLIKK